MGVCGYIYVYVCVCVCVCVRARACVNRRTTIYVCMIQNVSYFFLTQVLIKSGK